MTTITSLEELRARYAAPGARSLAKELAELEHHSKTFIEMSPFVVIASVGANGQTDASPRGGEPGFVQVLDERHVLIPDASGNNRLDTLCNIVENGQVSLLFMIPGINETLRINGRARLRDDAALIARFREEKHPPRLVIEVAIDVAYLQCPKAYMRARLWDPDARVDRRILPSLAQIIAEQAHLEEATETQEEAEIRYRKVLDEQG